MERDLNGTGLKTGHYTGGGNGAVIGEADLDRDVEASVVVRVNVEGDCGGECGGRVQEEIDLSKVLERKRTCWPRGVRVLGDRNVFDPLAVEGGWAEIGDGVAGGESAGDGKGREEPGRLGEKIVEGDGVRDAVWAGPIARWWCGCGVLNFGGRAGRKTEVGTSGSGGKSFERGGAELVVGSGDAANGAGQRDIGNVRVADERGEGNLKSYGAGG